MKEANLSKVTHQDLVHYGIIPELAGRLPVITALDPVDEDMLVRIMTEPKNSVIKQYQALMKMDGIDLVFEEDALREIAKKTVERKMGARGLRSSVEHVLRHVMFDAPSNKKIKTVTVTKECITENKEPKIAQFI